MKSKCCFCAARLEERRRRRGDIEQILHHQSQPVLVSDPSLTDDYRWVSKQLRPRDLTPDATLSFRVAFEPKDSYIFARGQNIRIILPKPKELFELFGFEAKKRVRTATKI